MGRTSKFVREITIHFTGKDVKNAFRLAKEKLEKSGKYEYVSCSSGQYKGYGEEITVSCTVVKPLTDNIRKKLRISNKNEEKRITNIMGGYGVEPCSKWKLCQDEFIKEFNLGKNPAYPYPVSSVEMGMFSSGMKASMIERCINPFKAKHVDRAINKTLAKTPYTNWSGD